jgi:KaiC/GvpD/RAD55 family RecA-like ATPase
VLQPARIVYFFDYEEPMKEPLLNHLLINWIKEKTASIETSYTAKELKKEWDNSGMDLRSFVTVKRKEMIDVECATST